MSSKRIPKIPAYLMGAYPETIAEVLGVSLAVARAAKDAASVRMARVAHDAACVRGEVSSEEVR